MGILTNLGILSSSGKDSQVVQKMITDRVSDTMKNGRPTLKIPIGSMSTSVESTDFSKNTPGKLDNRKDHEIFHKTWIEDIPSKLITSIDFESNFSVPIYDVSKLSESLVLAGKWAGPTLNLPTPLPAPAALLALLVPPLAPPVVEPWTSVMSYTLSLVKPVVNVPKNQSFVNDNTRLKTYYDLFFAALLSYYPTCFSACLPVAPFNPKSCFNLPVHDVFIKQAVMIPETSAPTTNIKSVMLCLSIILAELATLVAIGTIIGSGSIVKSIASERGFM